MRNVSSKRKVSHGIAAVEFAVLLPPVVLMILGIIECSRAFGVQHALQEASMNGCRIYALGDKTQQEAIDMINLSLADTGFTGCTITFDPPLKSSVDVDLEPVKVTLGVPYNNVGFGLVGVFAGSTVTATSVLPADLLGAGTSVGTGLPPGGGGGGDDDDDDDD